VLFDLEKGRFLTTLAPLKVVFFGAYMPACSGNANLFSGLTLHIGEAVSFGWFSFFTKLKGRGENLLGELLRAGILYALNKYRVKEKISLVRPEKK